MVLKVFPLSTEISVEGPPQGKWTFADWEKISDDGNIYEVINGVLYVSTSPSLFHNYMIRRLDQLVGMPAEQSGLAFAATDGVGVIMPGCEPVRPDFVIVLKEHASILDKKIEGVPDLIVEVLSPSNADYDEGVKLEAYAEGGVPEYAVVDPFKRQMRRYELNALGKYSTPQVYEASDIVTFKCLPTISFRLSQLFEGAPTTKL